MLHINEEIEQLHQLIASPPDAAATGFFSRLYAWGVLSLFNRVNNELELLCDQLDTSIDLDALGIKFDTYCDIDYWTPYWNKPPKIDWSSENHQTAINRMTDYLPNGKEEYLVTPEVLDSFKTAMHQLCDEERISARALGYALDRGIDKIQQLLYELQRKVMSPEPHLYEKLWEKIYSSYEDDEYVERFSGWYQDVGKPTFEELKAKQKQEIFELLRRNFFRYAKPPTGGEVKNRNLVITEDDLEVGCEVTREFEIECAKFDKLIEWKEDCILIVNYERLGQYIYKNYAKLDSDDFFNIKNFDCIMELIHEEMAKLKPGLAKYLKRYQEHQDEELLNDLKKIFEPFKEYLKEDIKPTLIDEYLEKLLFDSEIKEEAKKKLSGQSRNTYCCSIVIALSFSYIFKPEYNNSDYAKALHQIIDSVEKKNLERYLKDSKISNSTLNSWTTHIMDDLKATPISWPETG